MTSSQLVASLQDPKCYSHPVSQVTVVETHISWVLLTGQYVYKIKKPVLFSFVDFSTLEKRRWFCEEEVRLNRRLAPQLYLGVVSITGSPSDPRMDGDGSPFEWAVKMKQFPPDQEFQYLLETGNLHESMVGQLAIDIGTFHVRIEPAGESLSYGELDRVWGPIAESFEGIPLAALPTRIQFCMKDIEEWTNQEWKRLRPKLRERKSSGQIRECHGDLHLGNIALFDGRICVFDSLEFKPELRWIDVISEVAFLVMDLESSKRVDLAYWFLNCYLEVTGDYAGMSVFRLYEVYRALVRAKVAGLRLAQVESGGPVQEEILNEIIRYVELAHRLMMPAPPMLILTHGVSGTGKTTVSTEVVKAMGAVRVRSDVERKRIHSKQCKVGAGPETSKRLYASDMTRVTYDRLWDLANTMLEAGYSVVVDATFLEGAQRQSFIRLAHERHVTILILDVWAPDEVLAERIASRAKQQTDASDATIGVMEEQKAKEEPLTQAEQDTTIRVDSTDLETFRSTIRSFIEQRRNSET
ncbi:bifunctional aminoglycoside phosphotransferase/ATP-binding protein [Candidatus Nitrospira allomarina]|uniref:AAA family ATPase n=1 Tax=Candidatus Nitrospira allomarina TaxID=3020900 RepID=A0AA96GLK7_9BACT|nr:AAA family ATPase [Candidatus Nitrospira allomarina]WNM59801.1 AAA family ATPase [Candidatus Nitrospira allomarina]